MINVGFIGLGGMGRYQAASFKQLSECKIVAGSDPSEAARGEFAKIAPGAAAYADYHDLLADKNVEAVVIAVPTGHHKQVTLDVIESGRPVLVEKPMARTVRECREMIDAADRSGAVLMVAHCRRFDNDWGTYANVYRSGELGEQVLWRDIRGGIGPRATWFMDEQLGGGPLMDGAIHNQDFANYLWGQAESVSGSSIKFDPSATAIDTGNAIVRYRNGCQLLLSWSWAVNGQSMHDVLGAKSTFVFGPGKLTPPEGYKGHTLIDPRGAHRLVRFEPRDMYVTQAQHFLDCVRGVEKCQSPGTEAIKAVAVCEALLKACREGGVVKIAS